VRPGNADLYRDGGQFGILDDDVDMDQNIDVELRLQAHLDGEIEASQAVEFEAWLAGSAEARLLEAELREVTRLMREAGELQRSIPVSGAFYWNQIARQIRPVQGPAAWFEGAAAVDVVGAWWRRMMAPLSVSAAAAAVLLWLGPIMKTIPGDSFLMVEDKLEQTGSISFHSDEDRMTVVWVYDRDLASSGPLSATDFE